MSQFRFILEPYISQRIGANALPVVKGIFLHLRLIKKKRVYKRKY